MVFGSNPIMYTIQQNSNIFLNSVRSHNCTISNIVIKVVRMDTKWRKAHSSLFQNSPRLPQSLHLLARKHMQRPTRRQIIPVDSEFWGIKANSRQSFSLLVVQHECQGSKTNATIFPSNVNTRWCKNAMVWPNIQYSLILWMTFMPGSDTNQRASHLFVES